MRGDWALAALGPARVARDLGQRMGTAGLQGLWQAHRLAMRCTHACLPQLPQQCSWQVGAQLCKPAAVPGQCWNLSRRRGLLLDCSA